MISTQHQANFICKKRSQSFNNHPLQEKEKFPESSSLNISLNIKKKKSNKSKGILTDKPKLSQENRFVKCYNAIENGGEINAFYQNQHQSLPSAYETPKFSFRNSHQKSCVIENDKEDIKMSLNSYESSPTQQSIDSSSFRGENFSFGKQLKTVDWNLTDMDEEALQTQKNKEEIKLQRYIYPVIENKVGSLQSASSKNKNWIALSENQLLNEQFSEMCIFNSKQQSNRENVSNLVLGISNRSLQPTLKPKISSIQFKLKSLNKQNKTSLQSNIKPSYNFYNFLDKENVLTPQSFPPPKGPPKKIAKPFQLSVPQSSQDFNNSKNIKQLFPLTKRNQASQRASLNLSFEEGQNNHKRESSLKDQMFQNMSLDASDNISLEEDQKKIKQRVRYLHSLKMKSLM